MNDNYNTGHVGWSPDFKSTPTLPRLKSLIPSDSASCSADVRRRIMDMDDRLQRELTPQETVMILAADVYAHRNWHNLGSTETTMVEMLVRAGYLTPCSHGFTGRPSLPNAKSAGTDTSAPRP